MSSITDKITAFLADDKLSDAITLLTEAARDAAAHRVIDEVESINQTYGYLVHYMLEGVADNNRDANFAELKERLLVAASKLECLVNTAESTHLWYSEARKSQWNADHGNNEASLENLINKLQSSEAMTALAETSETYDKGLYEERYRNLDELFRRIWTIAFPAKNEIAELRKIFSDDFSDDARCLVASALLMSLLQWYDRSKLLLLIDAYDMSQSPIVQARLLIGIILTFYAYPTRIAGDKDICDRIELWHDDLLTHQRINSAIMTLIKAIDTDRINDKLRKEVIPQFMKLQPDIKKKFKDINPENAAEMFDGNPEWEELLHKSGLGKKLEELQDLQMEGADLMMAAFANLKSLSFFRDIFAWFLPYSANHPSLENLRQVCQDLSEFLESKMVMCDSDKYSFLLALEQMPADQKKLFMGNFNAQVTQMKEAMAEDRHFKPSVTSEFDDSMRMYVRDLYRFFRLFPRKKEFLDPLENSMNFTSLPVIGQWLKDESFLNVASEFLFKHKHYAHALSLFVMLDKEESTPSRLEKIGFCYQQLGDLVSALDFYHKAELAGAQSNWLTKRIAHLSRRLFKFADAAEYFHRIVDENPDDTGAIKHLADALMNTGNYGEALLYYYQAFYLNADDVVAIRGIARCEALAGQLDKAREYMQKVLVSSPEADDYIFAGHLEMLDKNYKSALSWYAKASQESGLPKEEVRNRIAEDSAMLESHGVPSVDIAIIKDRLGAK